MKKSGKKQKALLMSLLTASLAVGSLGAAHAADQSTGEYDKQIINDQYIGQAKELGKFWQGQGVLKDTTYTFNKDVTLNTNYTPGGNVGTTFNTWEFGNIMWAGYQPGTIDLNNHTMTLKASADDVNMKPAGIVVQSETLTMNNVGGLNIESTNEKNNALGILVVGSKSRGAWWNGDGNSKLVINNDLDPTHAVKIRTNAPGSITNGIKIDKNSGTAELDIKGLVDVEVGENAQGVWNLGGTLNIGGGSINASGGTAFRTSGGTSNLNAKTTDNGIEAVNPDAPVKIQGNVRYNENSTVNVALANKDSSITGLIAQENNKTAGNMNLLMAEGATWNHTGTDEKFQESYVTSLTSNKGIIQQNSTKNITVNKLKGETSVVYTHANQGENPGDFTGGKFTVNSAEAGSVVNMVTDSNGIQLDNQESYSKVLNNLANKLTYTGWTKGEYKLAGKVQVASGLTSSAAALDKPITFSDSTGNGYYTDKVRPEQTKTDFTATITGNKEKDKEYVDQGVLYEEGNYTFRQDSTITPAVNTPAIAPEAAVNINDENKTLTLNVNNDTADVAAVNVNNPEAGLKVGNGTVNINVSSSQQAAGIAITQTKDDNTVTIGGTTNIAAKGNKAYGILLNGNNETDFNGTVNVNSIEATSTSPEDGAAVALLGGEDIYGEGDFNGDLNIKSQNTGILLNSGGQLNLNGNTNIAVTPNETTPNYAIYGKLGTLSINTNGDTDKTNVNIKGNIGIVPDDVMSPSLTMYLQNDKSKFTGILYNKAKNSGSVEFDIANGAIWENQSVGMAPSDYAGGNITTLYGGSSMAKAGYVHMMDTKDLTIQSLAGSMNFFYDHTGDGTKAEDFKGGNVHIKKIVTDQGTTPIAIMSTDNAGIEDIQDKEVVNKVLNNLANKLYYEDSQDFYAEARISSGLTSSAQTLTKGRITFKDNKQGQYNPPTTSLDEDVPPVVVTGNPKTDEESKNFYIDHNIMDAEGNYLFDQDVTINTTEKNNVSLGGNSVTGGIVVVAGRDQKLDLNLDFNNNDVDIDSQNKTDSIMTAGDFSAPIFIRTNGQKVTMQNINNLNLSSAADPNSRINAVGMAVVNSDVEFKNIKNTQIYVEGNKSKLTTGLRVSQGSFTDEKEFNIQMATDNPIMQISGGIDKKGSVINLGGGVFDFLHKNGTTFIDARDYGEININQTGKNKVNAMGNIMFTSSKGIEVNLNLGKDSKWVGGSLGVNNDKTGNVGLVNLTINNGAWWDSKIMQPAAPAPATTPTPSTNAGATTAPKASGLRTANTGDDTNTWKPKPKKKFEIKKKNPVQKAPALPSEQNINSLKGGLDEAVSGYIRRSDASPLTINKLDGYTTFIYKHLNDGSKNEDYTAGDTIINTATPNSGITVATDNTNVDLKSDEAVTKTLGALANKILYKAYLNNEHNITAKAVIASGLTADSLNVVVTKQMGFDKDTSRGVLSPKVDTNSMPFITGTDADTFYKDKGYLQDGVYKLPAETTIISDNGDSPIIGKGPLNIDSPDTVLTLDNRGSYSKSIFGLESVTGVPINITVKELDITTRNASGRAEAIHLKNANKEEANIVTINGDVKVNTHGTDYALGTYASGNSVLTINGNYTVKGNKDNPGISNTEPFMRNDDYYGESALYSGSDYNIQQGAKTIINGDVDIALTNGGGIVANGGYSYVEINGGGKVIMNTTDDRISHTYALVAQSGHIVMNMDKDGKTAGQNDLTIVGNIGLTDGSVNPAEPDKDTSIKLGLGTANSSFTGIVDNNFTDKLYNEDKYTTNMTLGLQNGATWNNQAMAPTKSNKSKVEHFVGGKDKAHRGVILQNSTMDMELNNYEGNAQIIIPHTMKKDRANFNDYGDVKIGKAAPESYVLLTTDNNGIDVNNDGMVKNTLTALANKLYYGNNKEDQNLAGQVSIASGLTAASKNLKIADIKFDGKNQGSLGEMTEDDIPAIAPAEQPGAGTQPDVNPNPGEQPSGGSETKPESGDKPAKPVIKPGDVQAGDYESVIMQGVRSATTAAAENYRHLNDMALDHLGELPKEAGEYTFAKVLAGKTDFNHNGAKADGKYRGMQAGYDKVSDHGAAGVQVLYAKEKDTLATGHSDNKAVVLSAYAKKDLNDKSFFGVMGSVGRVNSDYKVANEIFTTTVKGEYKASGLGLGMVYGQRLEHKDVTVTPEVSLMASRLNNSKYQASTPDGRVLNIDQQGINSLVGKFTTRFSKATKQGSIYGKIGLAHEFAGDIKGNYSSKDGGVKATSFSGKDTWIETALGAEFKSNHGFSTNIQLAKDFAGHNHKGWNGNINFQFQF